MTRFVTVVFISNTTPRSSSRLRSGRTERIILIVDRAHDPLQAVEAADQVSKANEIAFELDRAMPGLESKGRASHQPEVGLEEVRIELVGDPGGSEHGLGLEGHARPSRSGFRSGRTWARPCDGRRA